MHALAKLAVDTARGRGATYADVRIIHRRRQNLNAEDARISHLSDDADAGFGVRVLANGAWGFAASGILTRDEVQRVADRAVEVAKASAKAIAKPVEWAPEPAAELTFNSPCEIDPFDVSTPEKVELLLAINAALTKHEGIKKAFGRMGLRRDTKLYANSDGSVMESDITMTAVEYSATAVGEGEVKSRAYVPPPRTLGYENIDADDLIAN
ncbi:TldD/PmbA family protein, partial [Candidatus Poribacteria bacterium]|nr:TldD/PmbA family protein [Candidatus Poribacteria bacterium]